MLTRLQSVQIMEVLLGLGWLHPVETVDVFRSNMLAQIDLAVEAANLERFRNNFAGVTTVRFPRPIRMLCRPEVLVETYEEGKLISEFVNNAVDPKLRQNIASLGMDTYLKMMIEVRRSCFNALQQGHCWILCYYASHALESHCSLGLVHSRGPPPRQHPRRHTEHTPSDRDPRLRPRREALTEGDAVATHAPC